MNKNKGFINVILTVCCLAFLAGIGFLMHKNIEHIDTGYGNQLAAVVFANKQSAKQKETIQVSSNLKDTATEQVLVTDLAPCEMTEIDARFVTLNDGSIGYLIQKNDTLCDISRLTGYSVDELANYNQIRNVHLIYTDSILRIPNSKE